MNNRPAIVSDSDRQWALDQCPAWAVLTEQEYDEPELDRDPDLPPPPKSKPVLVWSKLVTNEIERFERFYMGERRGHSDWSRLWRKSWWPRVDVAKRFPHLIPPEAGLTYSVFRVGQAEFYRALAIAKPAERKLWEHIGVVQFRSDDPRLQRIIEAPQPELSVRTKRMLGERE